MQTLQERAGIREEIVDIVHDIEICGFFRKKVIVYGANEFYNYIRIVNDYETGEILNEKYENILKVNIRQGFA